MRKEGAMLDPLAGQLERYMDLLSARQHLVASNIANADTPGYRTQDIDFQTEFASAVGGAPTIVEAQGLKAKKATISTSRSAMRCEGILDGRFILSRELAAQGHYPAIDILQSVSRLTSAIATTGQKDAARKMRAALSAYHDAQDLIQLGAYVAGRTRCSTGETGTPSSPYRRG